MDLESTVASLTPRLLAYALARTGCRAMAEDVAQDALTVLRAGRAVVRHALLAPLGVLRDAGHAGPNAEQAYAGRAELIQGVRHFADCRGSTVRRCCFAPPGN